jgi:hypothetical protein
MKLRMHPEVGQIPTLFVTAFAERAAPILQTGLAGPYVLSKPFKRDQIQHALRSMLRSKRRRVNARVRMTRDAILAAVNEIRPKLIKNLSLGGLFVVTDQRLPVGERVKLTLHYRKTQHVAEARVTHRQADGLGFAFTRVTTALLKYITATIQDLLSEGSAVDDRRNDARVAVSAAIVFSQGDARVGGELRDISSSGAFVGTDSSPPIGSETYVYLSGTTYSDGNNVESELRGCLTKVVRHAAGGFGCRFVDPSAEFVMALQNLTKGDEEAA